MQKRELLEKLTHLNSVEIISKTNHASIAKIAAQAKEEGRSVVVLTKNREEFTSIQNFLQLFDPLSNKIKSDIQKTEATKAAELENKRHSAWRTLPSFAHRNFTRQAWAERLASLYYIHSGQGLLCTVDNLLAKFPPINFFEDQRISVRKNDELNPDTLLEQLINWGYERVQMVANAGETARRGDIVDLVCPLYEEAIRIEFFGDIVEEIRLFNTQTQRSSVYLEQVDVISVHPIKKSNESSLATRERFIKLFQQANISDLAQASLLKAVDRHDFKLSPGIAYTNPSFLEDWLPKNTLWIIPEEIQLEEILKNVYSKFDADLEKDIIDNGIEQDVNFVLRSFERSKQSIQKFPRIEVQEMLMGIEQTGTQLQERTIRSFQDMFLHHHNNKTDFSRPWHQLVEGLKSWQKKYDQVLLSFYNQRSRDKFLKLIEQENIYPQTVYSAKNKGIYALVSQTTQGAELTWASLLILSENVLSPDGNKKTVTPKTAFKGLDNYDDLNTDDLLVHKDYGLGRFKGLFRLDLGGVSNDYLLLEYADGAKLYLPVDRLSLAQRFKGDGTPTLDKLGSTAWASSKEKAKKAIEAIAADLVEMYALRKVAKGFSYSPIGEIYREFEASFGFEETPDQAKAIADVLSDMEKPTPMDRLVCGDVGFGKTEVALRAAFRAAIDGRQVAMLCPTTVLAEQHYQTFRSRLAAFPVNVGILSRFVSKQKQTETETLKLVAKGQIDILIGTHRLLSADVNLPNLALLILDEEQRFGVRHKEKLKQLKKNVDALTLTATPIPRTLQLSMSGIRELSVIETPPTQRKPVVTALINRDKNTLKQILERELERQGQAFWIYNRVQGLDKVVEYVKSIVPQARIAMAHGQMPEKDLEAAMNNFWHGELDILVCTSIVESGLDFPRANTLIVDQAQMFGLGQLYQLRGRVGRSDRQAYAYFVVSNTESLSAIAKERMRIILDLDYLGAGFQLAMEDLRLRGAGNILGEVQSGHMTRLGLDLYLEMLEEAVAKLKGDELISTETELNIAIPAYIPETYITDTKERLKYYKALSSAPTESLRHEVELEIRDRFGVIPHELNVFLAVLDLKELACTLQAVKADIFSGHIKISWDSKQEAINPETIFSFVKKHEKRIKMLPPAILDIKYNMKLDIVEALTEVKQLLSSLQPNKK